MPTAVGPNTKGEENLVFGYDLGDVANSYKGQPTTNNFGGSFRDFTGTGYSLFGEWISSEPTRFTKTYFANLPTPIGPGGTLIEESGTAGFHHLSRYGGGDESGAHSLSCYIYPLVSGITDFCIGMLGDGSNNIQFNLDTKVITYGGGISNRNAFIRDVPGWPGWFRVGANFEGREGGWVGCIGYSSYTSYTGTAGGRKAYITGIQYEYTTQPTPFVAGTRSATQGLIDLTGNSTIDLTNVSFDSNAQMTFDGTNDRINLSDAAHLKFTNGSFTVEQVLIVNSISSKQRTFSKGSSGWSRGWHAAIRPTQWEFELSDGVSSPGNSFLISTATTVGTNHVVWAIENATTAKLYVNGAQVGSTQTITEGVDFATTTSTVGIGAFEAGGEYFDGKIPYTKLYNRALTASEIQSNYNAIKGRFM